MRTMQPTIQPGVLTFEPAERLRGLAKELRVLSRQDRPGTVQPGMLIEAEALEVIASAIESLALRSVPR